MQSTLLTRLLFLALCLLASARPQTERRHGPWAIGMVDDWDSSGNYLVYSCASRAPAVKELLDRTYLYLQTAILSTGSSAYKAFFRTADPAATRHVLQAISAGGNLTTTQYGSKRPTMVCVNDRDPGISSFWRLCQSNSEAVLIQPPQTSVVLLCPIFFELKQSPESTDCGVVNHANTQLLTHTHIQMTQYGTLVLALADMYLRETTDGRVLRRQERDENACLSLPPDQAVKNPGSYTFYASNVRAGCTQFPTRVRIERDRELLATDGSNGTQLLATGGGNGTGLVTVECVSNNTDSSSCP